MIEINVQQHVIDTYIKTVLSCMTCTLYVLQGLSFTNMMLRNAIQRNLQWSHAGLCERHGET